MKTHTIIKQNYKNYLWNLPNLILCGILIAVVIRALGYKSTRISSGDQYNDWFYTIFCVNNGDLLDKIGNTIQCSDLANFSSGILFGIGKFTQEFKTQIKSVGLVHLIVASGTQVAYLFNIVDWLFIRIGIIKKIRFFLIISSSIILFSLIGFTPPLIRSVIFIGLSTFIVTFLGRSIDGIRSLIYTIILILLFLPNYIYSVSLWLSAIASLSILIANWFKQDNWVDLIIQQLSVTIMLFPILSLFNNNFNFISIIFNVILSSLIPLFMVLLITTVIPIVTIVTSSITVFLIATCLNMLLFIDSLTNSYLNITIHRFTTLDFIIYYSLIAILLGVYNTYTIYNKPNIITLDQL
jgi:ComEC/Rec2-related protein